MNNKGFTLIELLAAISILAIIAVVAVPNVIDMSVRNKKEAYISDAKEFIAAAQYAKRKNSSLDTIISFDQIDASDFTKSPSGVPYTSGSVNVNENSVTLTDGCYKVEGTLEELYGDGRLDKVTGNGC